MHAGNWFFQDEIWTHIRNHQIRNLDETDPAIKNQLREYPTLKQGIMFEDLTWEDRLFVEEYLCNRTSVSYS